MLTDAIPTQQPPPDVDAARRHLAHLLLGDLTLDDRLAAAEALSVLSDVTPPYPPLLEPDDSGAGGDADVDADFREASHHLSRAIDTAPTGAEALRCAAAACALRERATPPAVEDRGSAS